MGEFSNLGRTDTTWQVTDEVAYAFGSHAVKLGGEFRRAKLFVYYLREARGAFYWDGTAGPWANDASFSTPEKALADFLGGCIAPGRGVIATGDPRRNWFVNSLYGYVQDTWQANPRLSLNLGLRYDYNGPFFDPTHTISTFLPGFTPTGLAFPGQPGSPINSLYPKDLDNFSPRFGFAFSPEKEGKTVIRGAWGLYHDVPNGNLFMDNRGATDAARSASRNPGGPNPVFTITNQSQITVVAGQYLFGSATPVPPFGAYGVNQDLRSPYVQNFSLNVQHRLTPSAILAIGYVGSQGRKLLITRNENQPLPSPTPYADFQAARPYASLFPQFAGITELSSSGDSHYNSLQVSLRSTSWHGFQGQIAYTLAHGRDEVSVARNNWPVDSNDVRGDWGNADFDTRHNLKGYFIFDVPQLVHSLPRLTKGWQINGLFSYDSGFPFSVVSGQGDSHTRSATSASAVLYDDRADQVGNPFSGIVQPAQARGLLTNGVRWFNAAAFAINAPGTFGNTKRNQFYGPLFKTIDLSVFKNTPITEKIIAQVRIEIFNIFNILNLARPDLCVCDGGSFGLISGTVHAGDAPGIGSGEPLNVQLGLKLIW